jgi:hypothetical protein
LTKSEKSQACWLKLHHHSFQWEDGYVSYNQARDLITKTIVTEPSLIYVKELEKKKWLCEILEDDNDLRIETIDAVYEDIARLKDLSVIGTLRCGYYTKHCALQNVCNLYKWWFERNVK